MTARTHDLAAITALGVVYVLMPQQTMSLATFMVAIVANMIGGVIPDIDQPTAPFWHNLPVGSYVGKLFGKMLGGHRFITHSLVGLILFGVLAHMLLLFLGPVLGSINTGFVWWAFMIGMVSHLVMDSFTKEGVPWLLPLPFKLGLPPVRAWRITTGKWVEFGIVFPLLIVVNVWFYSQHYQYVLYLLRTKIT